MQIGDGPTFSKISNLKFDSFYDFFKKNMVINVTVTKFDSQPIKAYKKIYNITLSHHTP